MQDGQVHAAVPRVQRHGLHRPRRQAALEAAIAQAEAARVLARNQGAVLEWDDVAFIDVSRDHAEKLAQELKPVFYEWSGQVGSDLVRDAEAVLDARSP